MFHSKEEVDSHVNEIFKNIKSEYQRNLKCLQIGRLYYNVKDYKSAVKYVNRYIVTTSNSAPALRLLGECYMELNLKVKALNAFKTSLELNGSQHILVLKICSLLMDPEILAMTPQATYWLSRGESLYPSSPIVRQLREHILKQNLDGKQLSGELEKLILSEVIARPTDVNVRIRLLNFFVETKRYKVAYQGALEVENKQTFSNDQRWYDCLCNVVQAYEKANNYLDFTFHIKKICFLERRAELFLQEFQDEVKTLTECSSALFALDQNLHSVSKIEVPQENVSFFKEFLKHMEAQLSFHMATFVLKEAKKECGAWPKASRAAAPLLLQATQNTMDMKDTWYGMWVGKDKMNMEVKNLNKGAALRISQAGHILLQWSQNNVAKFMEKVSQFCGGKWQNNIYQDIFCGEEHQQAIGTSHFVNDPFFSVVPKWIPTKSELQHFDEVAQTIHPDSLHHLVWLGLSYCNAIGQLSHNFRCTAISDLQLFGDNMSLAGPESMNQLDVDAFLYASILCSKSASPQITNMDRPNRLPIGISEELCTPAQAEWWTAAYKVNINSLKNISDVRLKLRKGIETIRALGQHGLHTKLIVMLAKLFQERAGASKNPTEAKTLENRAYMYWSAAIPLLVKTEKNQQQHRTIPNRLFDYRGKDLTQSEIMGHLEDGRLFMGCRLMNMERHEEAIEALQLLKSPHAAYYQGLIYEKLASEEVDRHGAAITPENRSQNEILLKKARNAFNLTLDRLRSPNVDPNHPLNLELDRHLEEIEKKLAAVETVNNAYAETGETDHVPLFLNSETENDVARSSLNNHYNASNLSNARNYEIPRTPKRIPLEKQEMKFEARPSPERLDAQLRHLVQANSNGLQSVAEQLKEIKSSMQIGLKDLGCVTRDMLAEMKKLNEKMEKLNESAKRETESIKPEELFNLGEEDYDDLNQMSQQYAPCQNYAMTRQVMNNQGTSTVTYSTPVPSPISSVIPDNPLLPPSFYPGPQLDPSVLLFQNLEYYQGLPYKDAQNVPPDYRGMGLQKDGRKMKGVALGIIANTFKGGEGFSTVPTSVSAATGTVMTTKSQPPNVVITSSDALPAFTNAGTPTMSVIVPPQHIRSPAVFSVAPKFNQTHPFQISMPSQAQLVSKSPTEKLNSIAPSTSHSAVSVENNAIFAPQQTHPSGDKTKISAGSIVTPEKNNQKTSSDETFKVPEEKEMILFKSEGQLFTLEGKKWTEHDKVSIKIVRKGEESKKLDVRLVRDPKFCWVFAITDKTILEPLKNSDNGWIFIGDDSNSNSDGTKLCLKFINGGDEFKKFEREFNEGRKMSIPRNDSRNPTKECRDCKKPFDGISDKICPDCESKTKLWSFDSKTKLGGFTFASSPVVSSPASKGPQPEKKDEKSNKNEIPPKPNPFAEFSFSSPAKNDSPINSSNNSQEKRESQNYFASVKVDSTAFKKDASFKGFEGQNSLVFQSLNKQQPTAKTTGNEGNEEGGEEEFVPTAEFKPVVDLPDLIDGKTGEENDEVLFDERSKLLRFDSTTKEWKERGVGNMKLLLNHESGRVRLIMRREIILKVCCNHCLDETMEFTPLKKSETALSWYAQDYSDGELQGIMFALKFKTQKLMGEFLDTIKKTQSRMKNGRIQGMGEGGSSTEEKPKELKPLSELFKPKAGSWECETCLIRNDESNVKCLSCETPKPGTKGESKEPSSQTKQLGKGITLPTTTAFTFGMPQQQQSNSSAADSSSTGKFIFGMPQRQATENSSEPFKFGMPGKQSPFPSKTGETFKFGMPAAASAASTAPDSTENSKTSDFSSALKFNFNTLQSTAANSFNPKGNFGPDAKKPENPPLKYSFNVDSGTGKTDSSFFADGLIFGRTQSNQSSTAPFFNASSGNFDKISAAAKENVANIFGGSISKTDSNQGQVRTFSFAPSKLEASGDKPESGSIFGSSLKLKEKEKFEFKFGDIKSATAKLSESEKNSSPDKKSAGDSASNEKPEQQEEKEEGEEEGEDNEDHAVYRPLVPLPEKVSLPTGEEDENLEYEQRAKLFRFFDKEWKERGIGTIKVLKHKTTNKIRLLMRRDTILKVCLNHYVTEDIEFILKDQKTWQWSSPDFSENDVQYNTFALRFKTPEIATGFMEILNKVKSSVSSPSKNSQLEGLTQEPTEAMKNFSFSTPTGVGKFSDRKPSESEEDVSIVYEKQVTPEQRKKAVNLDLPPNFYSYLQAPDCPGCAGCEEDDKTSSNQQTPNLVETQSNREKSSESKSIRSFDPGNETEKKFSFFGNKSAATDVVRFGAGGKVSNDQKDTDEESDRGESEFYIGEEDDGESDYKEISAMQDADNEESDGEDEEEYEEDDEDDEEDDEDDEEDENTGKIDKKEN